MCNSRVVSRMSPAMAAEVAKREGRGSPTAPSSAPTAPSTPSEPVSEAGRAAQARQRRSSLRISTGNSGVNIPQG